MTGERSGERRGEIGIVVVRDLRHRYGERVALDGVSFEVERGERFAFLGPNGGGKSTTFRILSTLMRPTSGEVAIAGHDLRAESAAIRRRLGVLFQAPSLDRHLTAHENLLHQGWLYGLKGADLAARVRSRLDFVGLLDRAGDRVETLSGGQRRRVEIAKALLHDPEVLLLDEPSTGLDPGARRDLWERLTALRDRDGTTALVTTHFIDEAERCERVAVLDQGRIVALGTPAELRATIGGDLVRVAGGEGEPQALATEIANALAVATSVVDEEVRVETPEAPAFVARLFAALPPGRIDRVTIAKPTLEDVFVRLTGRRLDDEAPHQAAGEAAA